MHQRSSPKWTTKEIQQLGTENSGDFNDAMKQFSGKAPKKSRLLQCMMK